MITLGLHIEYLNFRGKKYEVEQPEEDENKEPAHIGYFKLVSFVAYINKASLTQ